MKKGEDGKKLLDMEDIYREHFPGDDLELVFQLLRRNLIEWYDGNRRLLPWRNDPPPYRDKEGNVLTIRTRKGQNDDELADPDPYRVWVSEIMLQQTRVDTVIEYFTKWMELFPSVADLAKAEPEQVNSAWAGLGYYRRARNLHQGAKFVVTEFDGNIPDDLPGLLKIPGVGEYTAGAIGSIAFKRAVPLVDGNVIRVFSRLCAVSLQAKDAKLIKSCWKFARRIVDQQRPDAFNQALMELGATICTPKAPKCASCPISEHCVMYQTDRENFQNYPLKTKARVLPEETYAVAILQRERDGVREYLCVKRPSTGLLAGQWEFICVKTKERDSKELEKEISETTSKKRKAFINEMDLNEQIKRLDLHIFQQFDLCDACTETMLNKTKRRELGYFTHTFTHLRHNLVVQAITLENRFCADCDPPTCKSSRTVKWMTAKDLDTVGITKSMKVCLEMSLSKKTSSSAPGKTKRRTTATPPNQPSLLEMFNQTKRA